MPNYDFECKNCKNTKEIYRPFKSNVKPKCSNCEEKMEVKFTRSSKFHLKGSCWSSDGYQSTYKK